MESSVSAGDRLE